MPDVLDVKAGQDDRTQSDVNEQYARQRLGAILSGCCSVSGHHAFQIRNAHHG
jgi:hypothetical protein